MTNINPMLASPLAKGTIHDFAQWVAEEKYDGHRVMVEVGPSAAVTVWNPRGVSGAETVPASLVQSLRNLPAGIYDGELLAGDTATDVTRKDLHSTLHIALFDVVQLGGKSVASQTCDARRGLLESAVRIAGSPANVIVSERWSLTSKDDVMRLAQQVWARGGEGLILKLRTSIYENKRAVTWLKIKRLELYTLRLVGFEATKGTVMNRGQFAVCLLQDADGNKASCKTRDDAELRKIEAAWVAAGRPAVHPWVAAGRLLVVECGGRTRTNGYKGPVIWDRWENE